MGNKKSSIKKCLRLLDANANRCREGLRVIEDTARFVMRSEGLYKKARALRHGSDKLVRALYPELIAVRDSGGDSGRMIAEGKKAGLGAVVVSNFKRVEESLRVLEEYSKLISSVAGRGFKKIRFAVYSLEKEFYPPSQKTSAALLREVKKREILALGGNAKRITRRSCPPRRAPSAGGQLIRNHGLARGTP